MHDTHFSAVKRDGHLSEPFIRLLFTDELFSPKYQPSFDEQRVIFYTAEV